MIGLITRGYITVRTISIVVSPNASTPTGVSAVIDLPPLPPTGTGVTTT